MHKISVAAALLVGLALDGGCASTGLPPIVVASELAGNTEGLPRIERIRDLGRAIVPVRGPWSGVGDGVALPGEVLLIEGRNFGLSATVAVAERPATILGRTRGGHIVVRVPRSVPTGHVSITVQNGAGKISYGYDVARLAVMAHDDQTEFFTVDKDRAERIAKPIATLGAERVRISADGALAYVLAFAREQTQVAVIDLIAAGGPKLLHSHNLSHVGSLIASALDVPTVAIVGGGKVTLMTGDEAPKPAFELPPELRNPRAIDISPDGKLLALLMGDQNRVVLWGVEQQNAVAALNILPDANLPLVRDLAFGVDGETLWVVSGTSERTLPIIEPTRLTCVKISSSGSADKSRLLSVWKTQSIPGASAPLRIAIARGQPVASGSIVRIPPEKAAVFVTAVNDSIFRLSSIDLEKPEGAKQALRLWHPPQPGQVARGDISGGGGPLFMTAQVMSSLDVTPDAQLILTVAAQLTPTPVKDSAIVDFGLTMTPVWGTRQVRFMSLGKLRPERMRPPFQFGEVRIQP